MNHLNLPEDYLEFMANGKKLEYDPSCVEPGLVELTSLNQLELGAVWIDSDESPLKKDDPHAGEDIMKFQLFLYQVIVNHTTLNSFSCGYLMRRCLELGTVTTGIYTSSEAKPG